MKPKTRHIKRLHRKGAREKKNKENPKPKVNSRRRFFAKSKDGDVSVNQRVNCPYGRRDKERQYCKRW